MPEDNQSHPSSFLKEAKAPAGLKTFWFVRHGDTDKYLKDGTLTLASEKMIGGDKHWYTQGGGNNNPLSAKGRRQAMGIAPLLRTEPITNIRSSDLGRAIETTSLIRLQMPSSVRTRYDPNLRECDYGKWEHDYAPLSVFIGEDPDTQDSGEFSALVMKALEAAKEEGQCFVAHGNVLRTIAGALGVHLSRGDCANAQLLRFERQGDCWTVTNLSVVQ